MLQLASFQMFLKHNYTSMFITFLVSKYFQFYRIFISRNVNNSNIDIDYETISSTYLPSNVNDHLLFRAGI